MLKTNRPCCVVHLIQSSKSLKWLNHIVAHSRSWLFIHAEMGVQCWGEMKMRCCDPEQWSVSWWQWQGPEQWSCWHQCVRSPYSSPLLHWSGLRYDDDHDQHDDDTDDEIVQDDCSVFRKEYCNLRLDKIMMLDTGLSSPSQCQESVKYYCSAEIFNLFHLLTFKTSWSRY